MTHFRNLLVLLLGLALQARPAVPETAVPFVGCKSDGQVGPQPAPDAPDRVVRVDASIAARLSYYKAGLGPGVLGPRGWNCFQLIGSSGLWLSVTPGPINYKNLPSPGVGPAIRLDAWSGSGRSEVARVGARVFPALKDFAKELIDLGLARASEISFVPYPSDRLTYRGDRIVEYETPASSTGLGTMSGLQQNNDPIQGVAILKGTEPGLWHLAMRLPAGMRDLGTNIIRQVEQEP